VYLAHQVGGRDGTDDYVRMVDYNVTHLAAALAASRPPAYPQSEERT
jgi:hypothetical protein